MPYRIGDTPALTDAHNVATLFYYDPRSTYNPGAERLVTLAGTTADVGYPRAGWTFAALTIAQWATLRAIVGGYSGQVYVETRDDEDTFRIYRALARLPEPRDLERWGGYYKNVSIELLLLEML
jgi:hypothetical protein